jgi:precorrin-8X/cobalt-precorrin-8 methylmutase
MTPIYDRYLAVDWSAANTPKTGKDSIWIAEVARRGSRIRRLPSRNPPTRAMAIADITGVLLRARERGERVMAGFDFVFGYPAGAAKAITGKPNWQALWRKLADMVEDRDDNSSNRFDVAARINMAIMPGGPQYYGLPNGRVLEGLTLKRPTGTHGVVAERRIAESHGRGLQPVWKLIGVGSVGSQTILGIACLEALRRDPRLASEIAVWPFETAFDQQLDRPITLVEIYPSLLPMLRHPEKPIDQVQVETAAMRFATLDRAGSLGAILSAPEHMSVKQRAAVLREEGWIAGIGHQALFRGA